MRNPCTFLCGGMRSALLMNGLGAEMKPSWTGSYEVLLEEEIYNIQAHPALQEYAFTRYSLFSSLSILPFESPPLSVTTTCKIPLFKNN